MYQMIISDIDETLLTSRHTIAEADKQAIDRAQKQGCLFVLSSGRTYEQVKIFADELSLESYAVVCNGAAIVDLKTNEPLYQNTIPFELVRALFKQGQTWDYTVLLYTYNTVYIYNISGEERVRLEKRHVVVREFGAEQLEEFANLPIVKVNYLDLDFERLQTRKMELSKELRQNLEISFSSRRYMECNAKGTDKGVALLKLCDILDIKREQSIAIGDSYNDVPMLMQAGLALCPSNSELAVKTLSDVVLEADNDHCCIKEAIDRFVIDRGEKDE